MMLYQVEFLINFRVCRVELTCPAPSQFGHRFLESPSPVAPVPWHTGQVTIQSSARSYDLLGKNSPCLWVICMYVILIALSLSLLFLSSTSSSRLLSLLFASFRFSPAEILISTHVLSPNLSIVNCVLSKIKPAVQIGSGISGSETVCILWCARVHTKTLWSRFDKWKNHNAGGVGSRVVYKNLETSSAIHDNCGNLGEKRSLDRCRALLAD